MNFASPFFLKFFGIRKERGKKEEVKIYRARRAKTLPVAPSHSTMATTIRKAQLEASLHNEKKLIEDGRLKDENPLDMSENFSALCEACRRGDLKTCQEIIVDGVGGVNINARDRFDYTPLILVISYFLSSSPLFFLLRSIVGAS